MIGREIILEEGNSIKVIEGTRTIQKVESEDYNEKLWKHKDAITKVVFQNQKQSVGTVSYSYDISDVSDGSVMAYLVRNNDSSTYTAYIQAEDRIYTNVNSVGLFYDFTKLESIEGIEYLDTAQTESMALMFGNCSSLKTLDISHFDTSKVTNLGSMFSGCTSLETLDLGGIDTSQVIYMSAMFMGCSNLTTLDLSSFNTEKVIDMGTMFLGCSSLTSLDFRNATFTSVTNYDYMLYDVPSTIQITVKDATEQAWLQEQLGSGNGNFVIAS